mmetsp:Transcript_16567/g.36643  ORF Transcript_16567/g.36643 Transcript_16567/m.36643 type:complete len:293 (-) Transcript_16567:846-1724(-)
MSLGPQRIRLLGSSQRLSLRPTVRLFPARRTPFSAAPRSRRPPMPAQRSVTPARRLTFHLTRIPYQKKSPWAPGPTVGILTWWSRQVLQSSSPLLWSRRKKQFLEQLWTLLLRRSQSRRLWICRPPTSSSSSGPAMAWSGGDARRGGISRRVNGLHGVPELEVDDVGSCGRVATTARAASWPPPKCHPSPLRTTSTPRLWRSSSRPPTLLPRQPGPPLRTPRQEPISNTWSMAKPVPCRPSTPRRSTRLAAQPPGPSAVPRRPCQQSRQPRRPSWCMRLARPERNMGTKSST